MSVNVVYKSRMGTFRESVSVAANHVARMIYNGISKKQEVVIDTDRGKILIIAKAIKADGEGTGFRRTPRS